jgi:hypothetical protein
MRSIPRERFHHFHHEASFFLHKIVARAVISYINFFTLVIYGTTSYVTVVAPVVKTRGKGKKVMRPKKPIMLSVILLNVILLSVVLLSVVLLNVVLLSVVMLSVVAPMMI